jgi:mRNA-degrading endonuclease RelE of RelBE toxin-antitoxin system
MYELRYKPQARKYFKKIKNKGLASAFSNALTKISTDPYNAGTTKSGDLAGIYCCDVYHDKVNYEIAYRIYKENDSFVVIILAGTRENFYNELKKYM